MFILTKIADLVQIAPHDFDKDAAQAIEDNINAKYANKVIQKIGLCICLYDLLSASEGLIGHGTGLANVNVEFRLIVFRPFKNEVMTGRISSATQHGIRIRTPFFDEIFVPHKHLPAGSEFNHTEQLFIWTTPPPDSQTLYFDNQETVRFRIEAEHWHDQTPIGPTKVDGFGSNAGAGNSGTAPGAGGGGAGGVGGGAVGMGGNDRMSPYMLIASMEDAGLGPCLWWDGEEEGEE